MMQVLSSTARSSFPHSASDVLSLDVSEMAAVASWGIAGERWVIDGPRAGVGQYGDGKEPTGRGKVPCQQVPGNRPFAEVTDAAL
jgi:hypothetical protein